MIYIIRYAYVRDVKSNPTCRYVYKKKRQGVGLEDLHFFFFFIRRSQVQHHPLALVHAPLHPQPFSPWLTTLFMRASPHTERVSFFYIQSSMHRVASITKWREKNPNALTSVYSKRKYRKVVGIIILIYVCMYDFCSRFPFPYILGAHLHVKFNSMRRMSCFDPFWIF
jgi:hypothetical protein